MAEPKRAAEFLGDILRAAGATPQRVRVREALDRILGPDLGERCSVSGLRAGRLVLEVDSAPLYAELRGFAGEDLRRRLNDTLDDVKISEIVFRMSGTGHA